MAADHRAIAENLGSFCQSAGGSPFVRASSGHYTDSGRTLAGTGAAPQPLARRVETR
jgi:hypothetical protein